MSSKRRGGQESVSADSSATAQTGPYTKGLLILEARWFWAPEPMPEAQNPHHIRLCLQSIIDQIRPPYDAPYPTFCLQRPPSKRAVSQRLRILQQLPRELLCRDGIVLCDILGDFPKVCLGQIRYQDLVSHDPISPRSWSTVQLGSVSAERIPASIAAKASGVSSKLSH